MHTAEGNIQRTISYAEKLNMDRNTGQNRNEGAIDVVVNKCSLEVDLKVNETHVTNNRVQWGRLKIAKSKIADSCGDINVSLNSEIVQVYIRGNFKLVASTPEFMTDSVYLMKVLRKLFNSQDKELLLVLENIPENDDSLNLQNVRISNKAIEKEGIRKRVETSK